MPVDPRRLAALQIEIDALADELARDADPELRSALTTLRTAVKTTLEIVHERGLYLTLPHDYKWPFGRR